MLVKPRVRQPRASGIYLPQFAVQTKAKRLSSQHILKLITIIEKPPSYKNTIKNLKPHPSLPLSHSHRRPIKLQNPSKYLYI